MRWLITVLLLACNMASAIPPPPTEEELVRQQNQVAIFISQKRNTYDLAWYMSAWFGRDFVVTRDKEQKTLDVYVQQTVNGITTYYQLVCTVASPDL